MCAGTYRACLRSRYLRRPQRNGTGSQNAGSRNSSTALAAAAGRLQQRHHRHQVVRAHLLHRQPVSRAWCHRADRRLGSQACMDVYRPCRVRWRQRRRTGLAGMRGRLAATAKGQGEIALPGNAVPRPIRADHAQAPHCSGPDQSSAKDEALPTTATGADRLTGDAAIHEARRPLRTDPVYAAEAAVPVLDGAACRQAPGPGNCSNCSATTTTASSHARCYSVSSKRPGGGEDTFTYGPRYQRQACQAAKIEQGGPRVSADRPGLLDMAVTAAGHRCRGRHRAAGSRGPRPPWPGVGRACWSARPATPPRRATRNPPAGG